MAGRPKRDDISGLSFEQALAELEEVVAALESGSGGLEEAIKAYERGARLKRHCEERLKSAQERIEKITLAEGGGVTTEPLGRGGDGAGDPS